MREQDVICEKMFFRKDVVGIWGVPGDARWCGGGLELSGRVGYGGWATGGAERNQTPKTGWWDLILHLCTIVVLHKELAVVFSHTFLPTLIIANPSQTNY